MSFQIQPMGEALTYLLDQAKERRLPVAAQVMLIQALYLHRVDEMPEQGATTSRDYGRGYAQAIRDVKRMLES